MSTTKLRQRHRSMDGSAFSDHKDQTIRKINEKPNDEDNADDDDDDEVEVHFEVEELSMAILIAL